MPGCLWPYGSNRTPVYPPDSFLAGISFFEIRLSPFWFSGSFSFTTLSRLVNSCHCRLSSTASHIPMTLLEYPDSILPRSASLVQMCVDRRKRRVLCRGFFPWVYTPGTQGFTLHLLTRLHRPCLFSTTRESATLCSLPASGSPRRLGFMTPTTAFSARSVGLPWVRRITSPYPVQLHSGSVPQISGLAHPRLLDLFPTAI